MKIYHFALIAGAILLQMSLNACTDDTGELGLHPTEDGIASSDSSFDVKTQSVQLSSVRYSSTYSYLGRITDLETETEITASFAAQFHTFENYKFPTKAQVTAATGNTEAGVDSVELRLFFDSYYGDRNNPMKLEVYRLRKDKIMEETKDYYVDENLEEYADIASGPVATKVFTARDYTYSDAQASSSDYSQHVRISLDNTIGDEIMKAYYDKPANFRDSYTFIRNVCPGFYFRVTNGSGTMLKISVSTMNLFFRYKATETGKVENAVCRFAATPEVIQSTNFKGDDLANLIATDTCTYLKTPAGICTEATLPVNEIYRGHENDSISRAMVSFMRYNNKVNSIYNLEAPSYLLMVRKKDAADFFKKRMVSNQITSYTTSFTSAYNAYTFSNIGRLISHCKFERQKGIQQSGLSAEAWEAANPDWNKVLIIPVSVRSSADINGSTIETGVTHEMGMTSARLVGGTHPGGLMPDGKSNKYAHPQIHVIYSNFE